MCSKIDDIIIIRSCYLSEQIRFMSSGLNKLSVHPKRDAAIPPVYYFFFISLAYFFSFYSDGEEVSMLNRFMNQERFLTIGEV